jgi:hypothetical protein
VREMETEADYERERGKRGICSGKNQRVKAATCFSLFPAPPSRSISLALYCPLSHLVHHLPPVRRLVRETAKFSFTIG